VKIYTVGFHLVQRKLCYLAELLEGLTIWSNSRPLLGALEKRAVFFDHLTDQRQYSW
jgi:hypothetical protein